MITKARSLLALARRSWSQDISDAGIERPVREGTSAVLALISLIVIVAGVGAAVALTQIRSLKSEIAALHRELAPLKERVAQLDQAEKARRQAEQQQDAKDKSAIEKSSRLGGTQAALNLSSEEIQLVREYIRPAPSTGSPADAKPTAFLFAHNSQIRETQHDFPTGDTERLSQIAREAYRTS